MTLSSTTDPLCIFEDGKPKQGIYKIQNLYAETYLDIHQHSKEVCYRPARDLEDGRGLVYSYLSLTVRVPDVQKWEIKPLGVGYSVRRVSSPPRFGSWSAVVR